MRVCRSASLLALLLAVSTVPAAAQDADDFNPGLDGGVNAAALEPSGSVIVSGVFASAAGVPRVRLARFTASGTLDASFSPGVDSPAYAIAVLPATGQIVIAGEFTQVTVGAVVTPRQKIAKLNADGTLDATFNPGANGAIYALAVQTDGRILVAGAFTMLGGGGTGSTTRNRIARLFPDGSLDTTFNPGADFPIYSMALGPGGAIYVGGLFFGLGGGTGSTPRSRIGRIESNGTVNPTFDPGSSGVSYALAVQADGAVIAAGEFPTFGGAPRKGLARVDGTTGALHAFDPGINGFAATTLLIQADGRILVGGTFTGLGGGTGLTPRSNLGRLLADGTVDTTFDPGAGSSVQAMLMQRDGQLLVAGYFTTLGGGGVGSFPRSRIGRVALRQTRDEVLTVPANLASPLQWVTATRGPLITGADFSWSLDGVNYAPMGSDVGPKTTFSVPNVSLPTSPNVRVRARGRVNVGTYSGSTSVVQVEGPVTGRNMIENGDFSVWPGPWGTFDQPLGAGMVSAVNGGVFEFYRTDMGTQAVVLQETGMPVPNGARLFARFHVGNTDSVRKRISVLIHEADFTDLQVCTFWLEPNTPLHEYGMVANPTKDWRNAAISFYAATSGGGGVYQLDNVQMATTGAVSDQLAVCTDTAQSSPGGTLASNIIQNGTFASLGSFWSPYGQIDGTFTGVEYRFTKLSGLPSGVVLQSTGQALTTGQLVQLDFQLGLLAGVRGRVTVLVHDASFDDLAACTFWLDPKNPKRNFQMLMYATRPWTNATLSVYPASTLVGPVFQLDEVVMRPAIGAPGAGTLCQAGSVVGP